jgi:hypothetical protein
VSGRWRIHGCWPGSVRGDRVGLLANTRLLGISRRGPCLCSRADICRPQRSRGSLCVRFQQRAWRRCARVGGSFPRAEVPPRRANIPRSRPDADAAPHSRLLRLKPPGTSYAQSGRVGRRRHPSPHRPRCARPAGHRHATRRRLPAPPGRRTKDQATIDASASTIVIR